MYRGGNRGAAKRGYAIKRSSASSMEPLVCSSSSGSPSAYAASPIALNSANSFFHFFANAADRAL